MNTMKTIMTVFMMVGFASITSAQTPGKDKTGPCDPSLKYGKDSLTTIKNISMFNQYYKAKEYANCYPYWVYLFNETPCYSKIVTFNGPLIIKSYMKALKKEDKELYDSLKEGLKDTVLMTYPKRIELWGREGYVKGKWATDLARLRPSQRADALNLFEESVEADGNKSYSKTLIYYMQNAVKAHRKKKYSLDSLYNLYFQLADIVDYNLKNPSKKEKVVAGWVRADTTIEKMIKPFLKPDVVAEYFKPKVDADPSNLGLLKKAIGLMDAADGSSSPFYLELAEKRYPLEPSADAALSIARAYHAKQDYDKALEFYSKSIEGMEDATEKSKILGTMANLYNKQGNGSMATSKAREAVSLDENNGKAHLLIALSWAKMASSCKADKINGKSVYWAAYDKAARAKAADPSLEENANKLMNQCAAGFPDKSESFMSGFDKAQGSSFTVPCLGVSTTVRYK